MPDSMISGRLPAMAAITGAFITMGVAASGAAAFHQAVIQDVQSHPPYLEHAYIRLASMYDGAPQAYAEITVTAAGGHLHLDGGLSPVIIYNGTYLIPGGMIQPAGPLVTITYAGLLEMPSPASPGDAVPVIIRHPGGEDVLVVVVE